LDYFSRRLDHKYYENAMKIFHELAKNGHSPKLAVKTWELYDEAFMKSFPLVRKQDFVD